MSARGWRRQAGVISMWLVWGLLPMVGFGALAVDIGYMAVIDTQLQSAADVSAEVALGAVQRGGTQLDGRTQGLTYAGFNKVLGSGAILVSSDIIFGDYDYATETFRPAGSTFSPAVSVTTRRAVDFLLAPALGVNAGDISATAIAAAGCREIAILRCSCAKARSYRSPRTRSVSQRKVVASTGLGQSFRLHPKTRFGEP